ncbi:hypothetical protein [Nocardia fluminea]|uniref:Uncharacterized protein n=1 Tax=Nocardia fluminea TaxID=134984 RepID=A0A2N3V564_9NOCA|nr:hypothetical protein [Nocardia fluminea]PKV76770.1 hypothetical protein ATK86_7173 [Nocardia fluminea]
MTDPAIPTTAALDTLYAAANPVSGDQFVIYAPGGHDERGMYTVAHVTGPTDRVAIPRVHLVHPDDIAAYATGAVNRLRDRHAGWTVSVWLNRTTGPLHEHLPR